MRADDTDETLMLAYRYGDDAAFTRLFERHRDPLYRYVVRQVGNPSTAEELFQDIWTSVIRTRARYEVRAKFTTMLYQMASHRVIDHYRTSGTRSAVVMDAGDHGVEEYSNGAPTQARVVDAERQVEHMKSLIATLPPEQRDAFLLYEEAGLTLDQIAAITGATKEAAKSRLRYAVQKLKKGLGADA